MTDITIQTADVEERIEIAGMSQKDIIDKKDRILQAHGYDPETADIHVNGPIEERLGDLELAVGANGSGERGVVNRIDELEGRIAALEDAVF